MARLPTVADLGRRPVPGPQRGVTRLASAEATGQALAQFGGAVAQVGDEIHMQQATAAAKERDTYVSGEIRKLLYDPEAGFMNLQGRSAVERRSQIMQEIEALRSKAGEGLDKTASEMLSASLTRRVEGALTSIDQHTSGARRDWLTGASGARVSAALQDGLWNFAETKASLATIRNEIDEQAALNGWSTEETEQRFGEQRSNLYRAQIERVAASDPIAAMEYLRQNQDMMRPSDVAALEVTYSREVKVATGRAVANEAYAGLGNMSEAMKIAGDRLGMNENEQREALKTFMENGGAGLDPATTAWCAAFLNASLAHAGMEGTGSNMARSFLNWGVEVNAPEPGDVVVLHRDGPEGWEGHVGFFRGFDENGNVLLLGGNQGDAVTIQAYDAGRILGFRRGVAEVDEVDAAKIMQRLVQIEDPIERDAAIDQFNKQTAAAQGVVVAERNEARDQAFTWIERGDDIDEMPVSYRQSLGMESMSALRTYQRSVESGQQPETDQTFKTELLREYSGDTRAFAQHEPMEWINRLSPGDFEQMRGLWASARGQAVEGAQAVLTPRKVSELTSRVSAFVSKDFFSDDDERAAFINRLYDWALQNPEASNNDQDVQDQIRRMTVDAYINPPGLFNKVEGTSVELFDDPLNFDEELTLDTVLGDRTTFQLGGKDVPPQLVDMFMQSYAVDAYRTAYGRAPDMGREALAQWARENGVQPTARELIDGLLFTGLFQ